jgi:hypothetical protein
MRVTSPVVLAFASALVIASCAGVWLVFAHPRVESPVPYWIFSIAGLLTVLLPFRATRIWGPRVRVTILVGLGSIYVAFGTLAFGAFAAGQMSAGSVHSLGGALILLSIGLFLGCGRALYFYSLGIDINIDLLEQQLADSQLESSKRSRTPGNDEPE